MESTTPVSATVTQPPAGWLPRHSGRDSAAGCVWLPRLLDKGRRVLEGEGAGRDLLGDYLFGVNDPLDAALMRFLRVSNQDVLAVLRAEPDDALAAAELVRRSRRSAAACATWNALFTVFAAPFVLMIDADEGRLPPGPVTRLLHVVYNRVIMPPAYLYFRWAERRRLSA